MGRARTPVAKAAAIAADVKNPGRHKGRAAPKGVAGLGGPSMWLDLHGKRAFQAFKKELPWLEEADRVLVELASMYRGRLLDPEGQGLGLQAAQELRRCLAALGATPADRSKVTVPDDGEEDQDEALFVAASSAGPSAPRAH
jgi:hypothetical protein